MRILGRAGRKYVGFGLENPGAYEFAFILRRPREAQKPHLTYGYIRAAVQRCIDEKRFRNCNVEARQPGNLDGRARQHGDAHPPSPLPWAQKKAFIGMVVDSAVDGLVDGSR